MAKLDDDLARHHHAAFGWALACCRWDRSAAEDVLQTAYLKVIDGRARFVGQSEFRTFLFGVVRQTAREERRRSLIRAVLPLTALSREREVPSVFADGAERIERSETSAELINALNTLSPRQREVLHLVFYNDLTIEEAARVLNVSLGTARVHYERGKAQLRQILSK